MSIVKSVRLSDNEQKVMENLARKLGVEDFSQVAKMALGITSFLSKHANNEGIVTIIGDEAGHQINLKMFDASKSARTNEVSQNDKPVNSSNGKPKDTHHAV